MVSIFGLPLKNNVRITDRQQANYMRSVPYPTPGEILLEEFLKPMEITQYRLAKEIAVPQRRIGEIVAGKRAVTADTGLRLSQFFGTSEGFWTGLQDDYDRATTNQAIAKTLAQIKPWNTRRAA
jgi:addiction module HigA family antidote